MRDFIVKHGIIGHTVAFLLQILWVLLRLLLKVSAKYVRMDVVINVIDCDVRIKNIGARLKTKELGFRLDINTMKRRKGDV